MVGNSDEAPRADDGALGRTTVTAEQAAEATLPTADLGTGPVETGPGEQARLDADAPFRPPLNGNSASPLPVRPAGSLAATVVLPTEPSGAALVIAPEPRAPEAMLPADVSPILPPILPPLEPPVRLDPPRRPWVADAPLPPITLTAPLPSSPPPVVMTIPPGVVAPDPIVVPVVAVAPVAVHAPAPAPAPAKPPTGALVLLPGEEVLLQLGALYLTTRRAILYAPTILRATFLADIDAVGTVTERSGGWMFLIGLISLGAGAAAAYVGLTQPGIAWQLGEFLQASPLLIAIPLVVLGLFTLASYFFWVKRSLFLSVGGRPLIVVSVTGWSAKKLEPVDQFVNAFSAAKDRELRQG